MSLFSSNSNHSQNQQQSGEKCWPHVDLQNLLFYNFTAPASILLFGAICCLLISFLTLRTGNSVLYFYYLFHFFRNPSRNVPLQMVENFSTQPATSPALPTPQQRAAVAAKMMALMNGQQHHRLHWRIQSVHLKSCEFVWNGFAHDWHCWRLAVAQQLHGLSIGNTRRLLALALRLGFLQRWQMPGLVLFCWQKLSATKRWKIGL